MDFVTNNPFFEHDFIYKCTQIQHKSLVRLLYQLRMIERRFIMNEENNQNNNQEFESVENPNFIMQEPNESMQTSNIVNDNSFTQESVSQEAPIMYGEEVYTQSIQEETCQQENQQETHQVPHQEVQQPQQLYTPASYTMGAQSSDSKKKKSKKPSSPKGKYVAKLVASALCFGLVAGAVMTGIQYAAGQMWGGKNTASLQSTATIQTVNEKDDAIAQEPSGKGNVSSVVENVMPSIVSITSTVATSNWVFGDQESTSAGSGIIISKNDKELLVVTNNHVIDGASKIQVGFVDNEAVDAEVKGKDPSSDLAVLAVKLEDMKSDTLKNIKMAVLGDSSKLNVGQEVIAIGNALGYGQSVTTGVISALDREVRTTDYSMKLLQTDAAINPGNSGGALLNSKGEVIGINSVKYAASEVEGMGYAIPVTTASPIINDLMNEVVIPKSEQAYLGITGSNISDDLASMYNMPEGVWVGEVADGSPAQQGGLQQRDIIFEFDGKTINRMESLQQYLGKHRAGDKVELKVKRQGVNGEYVDKTLTVVLGKKSMMNQ